MNKNRYEAGDRIGRGDLIKAYIELHEVPRHQRGPRWHQQERLICATLNQITDEVAHLPGTITVIPPRPPIQPTDTIPPRPPIQPTGKLTTYGSKPCPPPTPGPSASSTGPKPKPPT